jgi:hypothetical protein
MVRTLLICSSSLSSGSSSESDSITLARFLIGGGFEEATDDGSASARALLTSPMDWSSSAAGWVRDRSAAVCSGEESRIEASGSGWAAGLRR